MTPFNGQNSLRPTQTQESDLANEGGTAPGGIVAFTGAASQWSTSNEAARNNFPTGEPNVDPVSAWKIGARGAPDEAPTEKGDVSVHPGLQTGLFRTARDANYTSPDGEAEAPSQTNTNYSAFETGGHPLTPNGKSRGQSPEIEKNPRGAYRP
jgi:hypothetical protein